MKKLNRVCFVNLPDIYQKDQNKNSSKHFQAYSDCRNADFEPKGRRNLDQFQEQQKRQLASQNSHKDSANKTDQGTKQILQHHNPADMLLFQPENVVKSQFLLSSFHEETVAVQQENKGENNNNANSHSRDHQHVTTVTDRFHSCIMIDKKHHIQHCHIEQTRQNIGHIDLFVFSDVYNCQPGKKSLTHDTHRPSSKWLRYRKSSGTSPLLFSRRDRSGGKLHHLL